MESIPSPNTKDWLPALDLLCAERISGDLFSYDSGQEYHADDKKTIKRIMKTLKKPVVGTSVKLQNFFSV
eukprot:scaffold15147_cov53-Prasinocladus_malaysianus.AAC.1